jgi:hypothetical protein
LVVAVLLEMRYLEALVAILYLALLHLLAVALGVVQIAMVVMVALVVAHLMKAKPEALVIPLAQTHRKEIMAVQQEPAPMLVEAAGAVQVKLVNLLPH